MDVGNLTQSCQQAEDALSQGMERLQQTLAESVAAGQMDEGRYISQMTIAVEKLDALVSFVTQVKIYFRVFKHAVENDLVIGFLIQLRGVV